MRLQKKADGVVFADDALEKAFNSLSEDDWLKKALRKAIEDINENVFSGERIKKELIPREYIQKYGIDNLWWISLPDAWRMVYSIATNGRVIIAVILEYFDHKNYAKRFGYKT